MKKFFFLVLAVLLTAQLTKAQDHLWPLASDLNDTKGSLNGTNHGVTFGVDPVRGNVARFNGTGWASLPTFLKAMASDVSIALWIKMDTIVTWSRPFCFGSGSNPAEFMAFVPKADVAGIPGWPSFSMNSATIWDHGIDTSLIKFQKNNWYHVVVILRADSTLAYVNNQIVLEDGSFRDLSLTPLNDTNNMLGSDFWSDFIFKGSMSNLQVIAHGLTKEEVNTLYNSTVMTAIPTVSADNPRVYADGKSIKVELKQDVQNVTVSIYGLTGSLIAKDAISKISNLKLNTGVYMVQVKGASISYTTKVVVK